MTNLRKSDAQLDAEAGFMVPAQLLEELVLQIELSNPFPRSPRQPLTRWQKIRLLPIRAKWAIHDAIFGDHDAEYD
jgi:hypothetical protein